MAKDGAGWVVHKFGGTSVAGTDRYRGVAEILSKLSAPGGADHGIKQAVVVSAMSKVTDALIAVVEAAKSRDESYLPKLHALRDKHLATAHELLDEAGRAELESALARDFKDLEEILRGIWLTRAYSEKTQELVAGHGELWSAQLLNAYLCGRGRGRASDRGAPPASQWLDARQVLVVDSDESGVVIDWEASRKRIAEWLSKVTAPVCVITGFIASTRDGIPTTLKRNGSDFSASIFGSLLSAREISIWTDVDGVLSADPRLVPEAVVLDEMSYDEATELAYFGAKVVHPNTMAPAISQKIPIWIRNTFNPSHPGTRIGAASAASSRDPEGRIERPVKGFSTIEPMALLNVEGTGMMGVPGVAQRLFGSLREVGVSVVMISQASSEHSICFSVPEKQGALAKATVEKAFFAELHHGQIQKVELTPGCSILAAVGDSMARETGVAGRFFAALGQAQVNIRAIAQGSSERNISVVIDQADSRKGLRAVHSAFFLSHQTISIGVIGPGLIGGTLLAQLEAESRKLRERFKLDLRVRGIADSKRMLLSGEKEASLPLASWKKELESRSVPIDLGAFARHIRADHLPHAVLIDCTSNAELTKSYPAWLAQGLHIITPNKKANTGSLEFYQELRREARRGKRHYLYETTVGAGLPIINTLRDLVQTGDRVISIEGVLSGTLSFLFNSLQTGASFSEVVKEAKARGYTEPDPRDDLSGMDVGRKLVILAREMGLEIELDQVKVESLVPAALQKVSVDEFLAKLPAHDAEMAKLSGEARARGEVLRYVAMIRADEAAIASGNYQATVGLKAYPQAHSFARIQGGDNIVAFTTERYRAQPLIVQGPGAGPEVTAAGVFGDLLRLSSYLGATL